MSTEWYIELAKSGPWALAFCWLLNKVVNAWMKDRDQLVEALTKFGDTVVNNTQALKDLREEIKLDRQRWEQVNAGAAR